MTVDDPAEDHPECDSCGHEGVRLYEQPGGESVCLTCLRFTRSGMVRQRNTAECDHCGLEGQPHGSYGEQHRLKCPGCGAKWIVEPDLGDLRGEQA